MTQLTSLQFAKHFRDIIKKTSTERFCFILGSGASFQSGINTGGQLAEKWYGELKDDYWSQNLEEWKILLPIDEARLAECYSEIFQKRFEIHPQEGYDELNLLMESVAPSFGYSVLAQLLETKNNVVITTNFDNLVEEALFMYSEKRALVCGHEHLASFATISDNRPLIVKIHRDRQLNPLNTTDEIKKIKEEWIDVLNNIFLHCIPVFIGYGGNDGSLMNYLKEIAKFKNLFWCDLDENKLRQDVKGLIENHRGKFVKIDGFDELMFDVYSVLELPDVIASFTKRLFSIVDDFKESREKIKKN
jgi:hypothetical protein